MYFRRLHPAALLSLCKRINMQHRKSTTPSMHYSIYFALRSANSLLICVLFLKYNIDAEVKTHKAVSRAYSEKAIAVMAKANTGNLKPSQALNNYIAAMQQRAESYKE